LVEIEMRILLLSAALAWLALSSSPAQAVSYDRIDRKPVREPVYQTKTPYYALLLFGKGAEVRVWVVLDGGTVYLDRNRDGDLTGTDEKFGNLGAIKKIEIPHPTGKTRYLITGMSVFRDEGSPRPNLMADVDILGPVRYQQYCGAAMESAPGKAPLAHFDGPLTMGPVTNNWRVPPDLALATGEKPTDLRGHVGTLNAEYGCWVVVRSHNGEASAFPRGVSPVVDVEFPPKTAGGAPVKRRYPLDQFC
jgi:hypothetical protein